MLEVGMLNLLVLFFTSIVTTQNIAGVRIDALYKRTVL